MAGRSTLPLPAGVKVTDKELLEWGNIDPQEVASLVSEAFNEMIFSFGCPFSAFTHDFKDTCSPSLIIGSCTFSQRRTAMRRTHSGPKLDSI